MTRAPIPLVHADTLPSFSAVRPNERDVAAYDLLMARADDVTRRLIPARGLRDLMARELQLAARAILAGEHIRQAPDPIVEVQGDR